MAGNVAELVARACTALEAGGVVAFPTETFYALGAAVARADAVARVARLKGRAGAAPFPVLCADAAQAAGLARGGALPAAAAKLAARFWPGRLTIVVPARAGLPAEIAGGGEVGVRVSAHPVARALCAAAGPLVGTSANRSGAAPAARAADVQAAFGADVELIVEWDEGVEGTEPSTVVRAGPALEVLRAGAVAAADLAAALAA